MAGWLGAGDSAIARQCLQHLLQLDPRAATPCQPGDGGAFHEDHLVLQSYGVPCDPGHLGVGGRLTSSHHTKGTAPPAYPAGGNGQGTTTCDQPAMVGRQSRGSGLV